MSSGHRTRAKRRWKRAAWIYGDGPYAVVAYCNVTSVTLHESLEAAETSLAFIDRLGCGHACVRHHALDDVRKQRTA